MWIMTLWRLLFSLVSLCPLCDTLYLFALAESLECLVSLCALCNTLFLNMLYGSLVIYFHSLNH
jgi:hypothetical protein